jgi:hypothetical protein
MTTTAPLTLRCDVCSCLLNDKADDPGSRDCGGTCLRCMARIGDDPDALAVWKATHE